jgi:hypothetical protein
VNGIASEVGRRDKNDKWSITHQGPITYDIFASLHPLQQSVSYPAVPVSIQWTIFKTHFTTINTLKVIVKSRKKLHIACKYLDKFFYCYIQGRMQIVILWNLLEIQDKRSTARVLKLKE